MRIETKKSAHWISSQTHFLEASCEITRNIDSQTNKFVETFDKKMNVQATEFQSTRNAVAITDVKIRDAIQDENEPTLAEWFARHCTVHKQ